LLSDEQKDTLTDIAAESNPEGFVVAPCPCCQKGIVVMEPSIKSDDWGPMNGGTVESYRSEKSRCGRCGAFVYPVLSVHRKKYKPNE